MALILKPNTNKNPLLYNIRKSTFVLRNIKLDKAYQKKLNNLIYLTERNVVLQKIPFLSQYHYNTTIFQKGKPFFFLRKNYKWLFQNLLKKSYLTPNLLKFLHTAYWPSNSNYCWKTYYEYHGLELRQRLNDVKPKINKMTYFFSLIFKKNYIQNLLHLKTTRQRSRFNKYFTKLKYLYHLNLNKLKFQQEFLVKNSKKKKKSKNFVITEILNRFRYMKLPKFIIERREKKKFKNFFFITYRQRAFLKRMITFYFPLISLNIHEHNIHSLPMKTKKPKRV